MYLSKRYRPNKWPFWGLVAIEFPLTVALLALFGIAAPNLYRTKLWQDGATNGFNSSPKAGLYAAANYRPYTAPKVWSQFITNFNIVISVFSMFLMLTKTAMYMLKVWPPILSAFAHAGLVAIYAVSIVYQAGSDTSDPRHPQNGPPWYITKSCSVAHDQKLVGYCQQAKAAFACSVVMLVVFFAQLVLAIWSIFPSRSHAAERESKRVARESRWAHLDSLPASPSFAQSKAPPMSLNEITSSNNKPSSVPLLHPQTPRTLAFNRLGGTRDLPLRNHFGPDSEQQPAAAAASSTPKSPGFPSKFSLRSPTFPKSPLSPGFDSAARKVDEEMARPGPGSTTAAGGTGEIYFPPPPKVAVKGGK